jgi:hypothetical protein
MTKKSMFDPVLIEAEAEAPFAVSRLFRDMTDLELRVFCLLSAGLRQPDIAERLDVDPIVVKQTAKRLRVILDWLREFLPETERQRAEMERQKQMDERYTKYLDLWDTVMEKAREKLDAGEMSVVTLLLKDLSQRTFGVVPTRSKHEEKRTIEFRNAPPAIAERMGRLIDVTPEDE